MPSAGRVAAAYRSVDRATRTHTDDKEQTLWLPAGWLAVLLVMTAAAPSLGGESTSDGWRARGSVTKTVARATSKTKRSIFNGSYSRPAIRQVAFEDDIAGPALRTAGRMRTDRFMDGEYRVAQQDAGDAFGDTLRDSFERPFGLPATDSTDADTADSLFDEPAEQPAEENQDNGFDREQRKSIFDDEPSAAELDPPSDFSAEEIAPGDLAPGDIAEDLGAGRDDDDSLLREEANNCSEGLAELKASRLSMIDLNIGVTGNEGEDYPYHCTLEDGSVFAPRCWGEVTYMWKASGLCHKPLYFEDEALERYGHSWGPFVQPLVSGAHFFGTVPILPYKMGLKTPNECVYALGHYRPGNCAPYLIDPIPFTWRAAIFQAGGAVGVAAFLP